MIDTRDLTTEIIVYDLDDGTIGWCAKTLAYGCAIVGLTLEQWSPENPKIYPIEDEV